MNGRCVLCGIVVTLGLLVEHTRAEQPLDLKTELSKRLLDTDTTLDEVQRHLELRVPRLRDAKHVKTAAEWETLATKWRQDVLDKVVFRGEAAKWREHKLVVEDVGEALKGPGYVVQKLRYECLPGLWVPALLYVPEKLAGANADEAVKVPVVLNVNGHDANGKAADYKQIRCINLVKRGMVVLNPEWFGMGQFRQPAHAHGRMNQLDLCGTSGIAPFYLTMSKGLDLLLKHPHADTQRVAVAGLSGGGWQTVFISGLDLRVTLSNPVAGYSSYLTRIRHFSDLGDSEQTPCDLGKYVDYVHLTAMRAPRATLLTFNAHDNCCFAAGHALPPLLAACRPAYSLFGETDRLVSHVNHVPGDHNFGQDNREAFYRAVGAFFFHGAKDFDAQEIPCDPSEIKKADELNVELPANNASFETLAKTLSEKLPRAAEPPADKKALSEWQARRRTLLAELVAAKAFDTVAEEAKLPELANAISPKLGTTAVHRWRLRLNDTWTVPVVELQRGEPKSTTIVIADAGRGAVADEIEQRLANGERVLAVDPIFFGESHIAARGWLWNLLLDTVGERPLGLQASQLAAVARWAHDTDRSGGTVTISSVGPRTGFIALVTTALEPQSIGRLQQRDAFASLKSFVIEAGRTVDAAPELFCFGLLEHFDVPQLLALIAPQKVEKR